MIAHRKTTVEDRQSLVPQTRVVLRLSGVLNVGDDDLLRLSALNDPLQIERDADGNLIIMAPAGHGTSNRNSELVTELSLWNREHGDGIMTGPDGGFKLPSGAVRAPDAAWVARERYEAVPADEREGYLPLCPDFACELRSRSDRLAPLQEKMEEYRASGCRLGWLLDPFDEAAYLYRPGQPPERISSFDETLRGEDVLPGFALDLSLLR